MTLIIIYSQLLFPQMKSVKTNISTAMWWSRPAYVCMITIRRRAVPHVHVRCRNTPHTGDTDRTDLAVTSPMSSPSQAGARGRCCLLQDALHQALWIQEECKKGSNRILLRNSPETWMHFTWLYFTWVICT